MLHVTVTRIVTEPEYQRFERQVELRSEVKLTPRTARMAVEVAFGVGYSPTTVSCGTQAYRVYRHSVRRMGSV